MPVSPPSCSTLQPSITPTPCVLPTDNKPLPTPSINISDTTRRPVVPSNKNKSPRTSRHKDDDRVKRPPNPFILFAADFRKKNKGPSNRVLSVQAGTIWNDLSESEKNGWREKAAAAKASHAEAHPGYRYQPRRSDKPYKRASRSKKATDVDDDLESTSTLEPKSDARHTLSIPAVPIETRRKGRRAFERGSSKKSINTRVKVESPTLETSFFEAIAKSPRQMKIEIGSIATPLYPLPRQETTDDFSTLEFLTGLGPNSNRQSQLETWDPVPGPSKQIRSPKTISSPVLPSPGPSFLKLEAVSPSLTMMDPSLISAPRLTWHRDEDGLASNSQGLAPWVFKAPFFAVGNQSSSQEVDNDLKIWLRRDQERSGPDAFGILNSLEMPMFDVSVPGFLEGSTTFRDTFDPAL